MMPRPLAMKVLFVSVSSPSSFARPFAIRLSSALPWHSPYWLKSSRLEIAGAVLGELLAIFVAGHHPGMRDEAFNMVINLARDLVSPTIEEMIADGRAPPEWRGVTQ